MDPLNFKCERVRSKKGLMSKILYTAIQQHFLKFKSDMRKDFIIKLSETDLSDAGIF